MQLTLTIDNEKLFKQIIGFLNRFKNDGLKIVMHQQESPSHPDNNEPRGLDFSSFSVPSFKGVDGLEFQDKIRNEW